MSEWISVEDKLPDVHVQVLCATNDTVFEWYVILRRSSKGGWVEVEGYEFWPCVVTHWMPLPKLP